MPLLRFCRRNKTPERAGTSENPYELPENLQENGAAALYNASTGSGNPYAVYTPRELYAPYALAGEENPNESSELAAETPPSPTFPVPNTSASADNAGFSSDDSYLLPGQQNAQYALVEERTANNPDASNEAAKNQPHNPYEEC